MKPEPAATAADVLERLGQLGLILVQDKVFPSLISMVAGCAISGSWWAHPLAHEMYGLLNSVCDDADVLCVKLVAGKDTLVHRAVWPALVAAACERSAWQFEGLDADALELLDAVDAAGELQSKGPLALALRRRLLVHGENIHTDAGHHEVRLIRWDRFWEAEGGFDCPEPEAGRLALETLVASLDGPRRRIRLPWVARRGTGSSAATGATR